MEKEADILKEKDAIHDCELRIKALDLELDEKSFKHRCIPQKKKNAESMIVKCLLPLIIITTLAVVGSIQAISVLAVLVANDGAGGGGMGISLIAYLLIGIFSIWIGFKLWVYVLRQVELLRDLQISDKKLEKEMRSLSAAKELHQKKKEEHESKLEELQYEQYLQEMSPDAVLQIDNLRKYLDARCRHIKNVEKRIAAPEVIEELFRFGYRTLGDIENALKEKTIDYFIPYDTTNYAGVLRNIMIINDCRAYFFEAYRGGWLQTSYERMKFWKDRGVTDIERYLKENKIQVKLG